ncbi:PLANT INTRACELLULAR RAS-GROUP-RELATED LRR PROTEIN [Salix viminalis]|uniref:PLANT INTRACELLULAR RAS-GROUP-RELATED LRR PROTEIN n=1 Tax=Salix viminalis TaxID=40686 RepID=A0A9Q0SDJ5_SALVM|nr:PLANT INTRACELLULAR RAS-GROUP-RELATED LRR PROTEIN [Salix viminalis]
MIYEQRRQQQQKQQQMMMNRVDRRKVVGEGRQAIEEEEVDLSGMSLETLPNPSLNLAAICKLNLSNNDLQTIPESLTARMLNLVVLDAHSNQLKSLPNSIGCLSKLKVLNVSCNLLESLPRTIENCRDPFLGSKSIDDLDHNVSLSRISNTPRSLEELNANFNKLSRLPDTIGFELVNLKKLSVNSNKLAFLPMSTSYITSLKILDARLNNLRSLPEDLENLVNLEVLNVSQNFQYLETLPFSIGLLLSLVELDVSYNKITALPDSMGCLRKLKKLSVEGNPLISPPMEVVEGGVDFVREYLSEKMNAGHNSSTKKKSWVGKLVKYATFNGRIGSRKDREGCNVTPDHYSSFDSAVYTGKSPKNTRKSSIEGLASPRYFGMFSPSRIFSSKNLS